MRFLGWKIFYANGSTAKSSVVSWDECPDADVQIVNYIYENRGKLYRFQAAGYESGVYEARENQGKSKKYGYWMTDEGFSRVQDKARDDWEY